MVVTPQQMHTWRKLNSKTQSDLAKELGVSTQTISNWERSRFAIPADLKLPAGVAVDEQIVCFDTHPHLYRIMRFPSGRIYKYARKLTHPRWFDLGEVLPSELANYKPPTVDEARRFLVERMGCSPFQVTEILAAAGAISDPFDNVDTNTFEEWRKKFTPAS